MTKFIPIILLLLLSTFCRAQDGRYDQSFGRGGIVKIDSANVRSPLIYTALQADGKIVVAANYQGQNETGFIVKRFLSSGDIDTAFNPTCKFITGSASLGYSVFGLAIQSTGRILLARENIVYGLLPNGYPDYSFGDSGMSSVEPVYALCMALQSNDDIVLGGLTNGYTNATTKLTANGKVDSTFGTNGMLTFTSSSSGASFVFSVATYPDGRILLGGDVEYYPNIVLVRCSSKGVLDTSFAHVGYSRFALETSTSGTISALSLQPDDKIVATGTLVTNSSSPRSYNSWLARFKQNGAVDSTFHNTGMFLTDSMFSNFNEYHLIYSSVCVQKDGRILQTFPADNSGNIAVHGFLPNGDVDSTFGMMGVTKTMVGDFGVPSSIAIQDDSKIIVTAAGGYQYWGSSIGATLRDLYLIRYVTSLRLGLLGGEKGAMGMEVYPNPIGEQAKIDYELSEAGVITIRLADLTGRIVQAFVVGEKRGVGAHSEVLKFDKALHQGNYVLSVTNSKWVKSVMVTKL